MITIYNNAIFLFTFWSFQHSTDTKVALELEKYNITWQSPSDNEQGSMPLGNGDIGIIAWALDQLLPIYRNISGSKKIKLEF